MHGSQSAAVHRGSHLAHDLTVNDGLVAGLDGGGVREDGDVSIKLPAGHGGVLGIHQHHTLAYSPPPDLLQGQGCCLACHHLRAAAWVSYQLLGAAAVDLRH